MPAVTFAKALDVIRLIAEGDTTLKACEACFISPVTFRAALAREPKLQQMFDEAEQVLHDILADTLIDVHKLPSDPKQASVISTNIRFILERRRPAKFGKVAETNNPDSETNRLLAQALNEAMHRIPSAPRAGPVMDLVATIVEPPKKMAPRQAAPSSDIRELTTTEDGHETLRRLGLI